MQAVLVCLVLLCRLCVAGCADDVESTLQKLSEITSTDAGEWKFQHPAQPGGEAVGFDDSTWSTVRPEHRWEGPETQAWYRRQFVIPTQVGGVGITGTRLTLRFAVDDDAEVFVNGQSRGTFHWDQGEVVLTESAQPGETVLVALRAINGPVYGRLMSASMGYGLFEPVRDEIEAHRRRLAFCGRLVSAPRAAARRQEYQQALERAARELDLTSAAFAEPRRLRASLERSREALRPLSELAKEYSLYLVGHAHIDMNWLWLWPETKEVCRLTWDQALKFMDEYPDFRFTQSQPGAYIAIEEENPELFSRIQQAVKDGKWEPAGASWVEGDTNMASGEILARHCLLTSSYYREKLGRRSELAWLPDNFGHAWTVPSIFSDAGYKYFYFCRAGRGAPLFWWKGPDGGSLLAFNDGWYNAKITDDLAELPLQMEARNGVPSSMVVYGVGDHGGGPTREDIEAAHRLSKDAFFPTVHFSTASDYYAAAAEAGGDLPEIRDELNFTFRGCYTTHGDIKKWNRSLENLLPVAESISAVGSLYGAEYPADSLTSAWRKACFNQFHDILPGTAIHGSYEYSGQLFEEAKASGEAAIQHGLAAVLGQVDTTGEGQAVAVWNPVAWERTDYCEVTVTTDAPWEGAQVRTAGGAALAGQVVASVPGDAGHLTTVGFVATLPALGYEVFHLAPAAADATGASQDAEGIRLSGGCDAQIRASTGQYSTALPGQEPFAQAAGLDVLHEAGVGMSAWELGAIRSTTTLDKPESVELISSGPVSRTARVLYRVHDSTLEQYITTYTGLPRVDIELRADWQELGSRELGAPLLKAAFPLPVENPEASFEIPWGAITRPANGEEVPGQKWIDVSETERTLVGTDQDSEPLDLSAHYNEDVIATPAAPADGDFDAGRRAYSSEVFSSVQGDTATVDGVPFRIPPVTDGRNNSIRCSGQTLQFAARRTSGLAVFGASSNGSHGGTARLQYETGPDQPVTLSLSDWCLQPGVDEVEAFSVGYRFVEGQRGEPATHIWMRRIPADPERALKAIVLPIESNLHVLGISFAAAYQSKALWGVSLLNDCKYGFDVSQPTAGQTRMRMSLLRASYEPDPTPDQGQHVIRYALYPHRGGWREAQTPRRALEFNQPPLAQAVESHAGTLPPRYSFVSVAPGEMVLSAFKQSEDGSGYVARVYNSAGVGGVAELTCNLPFASTQAVNVLEEPRAQQTVSAERPLVRVDLDGRIQSGVKLER